MGQNEGSLSRTRETPRETCIDTIHDKERFPQGPSENGGVLFSTPRRDPTDIKGRELHPLGTINHADTLTGEVTCNVIAESLSCLNLDGKSQGTARDNAEKERSLLDSHKMGKLPVSTSNDAPAKLNPSAEREDTAIPPVDVTRVRPSLEGRLNASFQETLKLNEEFIAEFQRCKHKLQEQERLVLQKGQKYSTLQSENQQLRELIPELNARTAQVVKLQDTVFEMQTSIEALRQDVKLLPFTWDEILEIEVGKTIGLLHRDNCELREDLRKCRIQLESATKERNLKTRESEQCRIQLRTVTEEHDLKTRESDQLKADILFLEEANSKLEQKVEQIQQQLCKERAGHHGSYVDGSQTPFLLESTAKDMFSSIASFSRFLSKYKDPMGQSAVHSLIIDSDLCKNIRVAREHHWTYMLKSFVCERLFRNFEYENFIGSNYGVLFLDPEERVDKCFAYCQKCKGSESDKATYHASNERFDSMFFFYFQCLCLLPLEMEPLCMLFQNSEELLQAARNKLLLQQPSDKSNILFSLILTAKKVWNFHKLCLSFDPPATVFKVSIGDPFNADYMESIDAPENDDRNTVPTVGFMIYPGFRLRKSIIKCQVYLALKN